MNKPRKDNTMKKYYLIPIIEDDIYLDGKPLRNILELLHPELVQREKKRIEILYSIPPIFEMPKIVKDKYEQHNIETKKMYEEAQVLEYLIAYGNDRCAKEIFTNTKIKGKYSAALGIRSVSKEKAMEYYITSNYAEKIHKYFNNIENINNNSVTVTKFHNFEGYIEGKIENKDVKGYFKGKIKTLEFHHR